MASPFALQFVLQAYSEARTGGRMLYGYFQDLKHYEAYPVDHIHTEDVHELN